MPYLQVSWLCACVKKLLLASQCNPSDVYKFVDVLFISIIALATVVAPGNSQLFMFSEQFVPDMIQGGCDSGTCDVFCCFVNNKLDWNVPCMTSISISCSWSLTHLRNYLTLGHCSKNCRWFKELSHFPLPLNPVTPYWPAISVQFTCWSSLHASRRASLSMVSFLVMYHELGKKA